MSDEIIILNIDQYEAILLNCDLISEMKERAGQEKLWRLNSVE